MDFRLFNELFAFVLLVCSKYGIDESHDISHSMNILNYAHNIYETETYINPGIKEHKNIIFVSSVLHDMCDKKYMDEEEGIKNIKDFLEKKVSEDEINAIVNIIKTMSYSKVKKDGFPNLGIYQRAYHIVREADLLCAYDFDRCVIYDMKVNKNKLSASINHAEELFENRVLKHNEDKLFTTEYAKTIYPQLHVQSIQRIKTWKSLLGK
tara:strand:- start:538 stop:1164 length:627 start_codon:yes stop_codon:yes gene_type:complete